VERPFSHFHGTAFGVSCSWLPITVWTLLHPSKIVFSGRTAPKAERPLNPILIRAFDLFRMSRYDGIRNE
jgi:hypothetical protein